MTSHISEPPLNQSVVKAFMDAAARPACELRPKSPRQQLLDCIQHNQTWLVEQFQYARRLKGCTVNEAAKQCQVDRTYLSNLLAGNRPISYFLYTQLCHWFQINPLGIKLHLTNQHIAQILLKHPHSDIVPTSCKTSLTKYETLLLHTLIYSLDKYDGQPYKDNVLLAQQLPGHVTYWHPGRVVDTISWKLNLQLYWQFALNRLGLTFDQLAAQHVLDPLKLAKLLFGQQAHDSLIEYNDYKDICLALKCNPCRLRLDLNKTDISHFLKGYSHEQAARDWHIDLVNFYGMRNNKQPITINWVIEARPKVVSWLTL